MSLSFKKFASNAFLCATLACVTSQAFASRPAPEASFAFVATDTKLWSEAGRFGEAIALLKTGVELKIIEYSSSQDWMRVQTASGRSGWIPVRFTTQGGRRTFPLNSQIAREGEGEEGGGGSRNPASVDLKAAGADVDPTKSWEGLLGLEYMNQATREKTSGFGFDLSALHRLTNNWSAGGALEWDRFSKSASAGNYKTSRSSSRYFPHLLFRYRWADFRADIGMGYALDHSSITTRDLSGNLVSYASDGTRVSGSGHESSLGFRITPRYILPLSRLLKIGFYVSYLMDVALQNGEGDFAGASDAITSPYSYFGAGMSVSLDF
ncbi:MAG: SH3 domain-containing protein [Bdellovibrionota bacterium]